MREIKFRGKTLKDGQWVYGSYVCRTMGNGKVKHDIIGTHGSAYVDPETVGLSTGMKDKANVEIFEGDVLKSLVTMANDTKLSLHCKVLWEQGGLYYKDDSNYCHPISHLCSWQYNVIGNVHDNPELAKL